MDTPKNRAGSITEEIMANIRIRMKNRNEPPLTGAVGNAVYDCVYEALARYVEPWPQEKK